MARLVHRARMAMNKLPAAQEQRLRKEARGTTRKILGAAVGATLVALVGVVASDMLLETEHDVSTHMRRKLASVGQCAEFEGSKAIVVPYLLIILYAFLGLAIVCDEYFEPALQMISEKLGLSEDVAGATFMAAGSSAPELFTSISDAFFTQNSIGIGTIVGSAMFNILVIVAMSAAVVKGSVHIDYRPVLRDAAFYLGSIGLLVLVLTNEPTVCYGSPLQVYEGEIDEDGFGIVPSPGTGNATTTTNNNNGTVGGERLPILDCGYVRWEEGLLMVIGYSLYILFMVFNQRILDNCPPPRDIRVYDVSAEDGVKIAAEAEEEEEDDEPWYKPPDGAFNKVYWIVSLPIVAGLKFTVPHVEEGPFKGWYITSFTMCILWIGLFCLLMVELASEIGCILNISGVIMGVVLLAAGTSVPDMIASMIVARQGHADMAIANAVGSNVFDILLGLGLPWMLVDPILNKDVLVEVDDIVVNVSILCGTVLLYLTTIVLNKWHVNRRMGMTFTFLYAAYITYTIITGLLKGS